MRIRTSVSFNGLYVMLKNLLKIKEKID